MKKIICLCFIALLCVGCSSEPMNKTENSDIETTVTSSFDDKQNRNSETETAVTTSNLIIITETVADEKEFIVTEPDIENIQTDVSTTSDSKPNQPVTSTDVSTVAIAETNVTTQATEKLTETTTTETKSGVIELPFVPVR